MFVYLILIAVLLPIIVLGVKVKSNFCSTLIMTITLLTGASLFIVLPAIWTPAELMEYGVSELGLGILMVACWILLLIVMPTVPIHFRAVEAEIINKYTWGRTALNTIAMIIFFTFIGIPAIYYGIPAYMHGREQKDVAALEQREGADPKAAALHWLAKVESKYDLLDDDIKRDQTDLCFSERVWNASYQEAFNQHWAWWVPSHHLMHPKGETTIELDSNPYFDYVEKKRKLLNQLYPKPNHQSIKERGVCFNGRHTVQTKANLVQFGNRPNEGKGFRVKNNQSLFSVDSVTASALDMEFAKNSH
ncbi:hypothetical protein RP726_05630 [Candidatus Methylospira mobilis]|uniref:hypothetical protein n=1 Tax=Candidatus Methylospira mobilis TaxID=1808979 RepID=UPI0028ED78DA|nr:hypothetical protein [Candidatus Methylospira mobilis]WNV05892.1 hypothetical protein RP726_05630 [Candidatus Methylospira mobilis]